jgi:predicted NBD/HSP70 family sugar kinase
MSTATNHQPKRGRAAVRDNLALILTLIRSGQAQTRQELERASGLGRAVVADRVATLISHGLLSEEGLAASTGGRAPRHLQFNASAGYVLAASLGTTTLGVGLADLSGRLLIEHHEPADIARGAEKTMSRVVELFEWMLSEYPVPGDAWAVSLALPGLVGAGGATPTDKVTLNLIPGWGDYPVHRRLSERFDAPVFIGNEVQLMALGELRGGRGIGRSDLIFVKVGTGISAGLCSDGRIHRGAAGFAGDIGHVAVVDDKTMVCRCGNSGCLEAVAAGASITREARLAAADGRSPYLAQLSESGAILSAAHVGSGADHGDPFSTELLARAGRLVGESLATLVAGYNPSIVVVGGGVAQSGSIFIAAVRDGIYRRSRSLTTDNLLLVASELGKTAGLIGGASAALDDLFDRDFIATWIEQGSPRLVPHDGPDGPPGPGNGLVLSHDPVGSLKTPIGGVATTAPIGSKREGS